MFLTAVVEKQVGLDDDKEQVSIEVCKPKREIIKKIDKAFVVDSGCTPNHMTNDSNILNNIKESKQLVSVAKKNQSMYSLGVGNVESDQCIKKNVSMSQILVTTSCRLMQSP